MKVCVPKFDWSNIPAEENFKRKKVNFWNCGVYFTLTIFASSMRKINNFPQRTLDFFLEGMSGLSQEVSKFQ